MGNHHRFAVLPLFALLGGLAGQGLVLAQEVLQTPAVPSPALANNPLQARPLDAQRLGGQRGGTDTFNDMSLRGVVADNRAVNVSTGGNLVSQGALSGMSGVPMLVQNTGNNVLIQSATIINVQLK
ncbi:hypothetical protein [Roseateles sp. DAIF2]|uniref:hypothetical protein n=1 Tax=Roseateles sp. DAIF2 TaxID=2714952 RepID=UPI001BC8E098|nr:hypothetical protein [Roseateles sp. DAIF2]